MKNTKLFCSLMLCYSGLMIAAAQPQEASLIEIMKEPYVRETLLPYFSIPDMVSLGDVSQGIRGAMDPAIQKAATWESQVLNALNLDFSNLDRRNHDDHFFINFVIQRIKDFARDYPGTWIKLDLSRNMVGNDLNFLRDLLQAAVTTAHTLKIDLASLNLSGNQLTTLPEHFFEGMNNLRSLDLRSNQMANLAENAFDGLDNLQELDLRYNELGSLPVHLFKGLKNLQILHLAQTRLTALHDRLFEGLYHLQLLDFDHNFLSNLPEKLFEGLNNLRRLELGANQLRDLPEHLFKGLNNLGWLELSGNWLEHLPEHIFEGVNNLQWLHLNGNQLSSLPERLFEGLPHLWELQVSGKGLNGKSIAILQTLRGRGVYVWW